ncbi:MAG: hypothetical protein HC921_08940 [Synechococcaceae cyanobacterium SM2_3_1]|nr:hypothetical protein [Synechococcaceae cyanobacterium SM2_3_1]
MSDPKQLYWHQGTLFVVTGFNQSMPAAETVVAQRLADRWKTQFELAQLLIRAGYQLLPNR